MARMTKRELSQYIERRMRHALNRSDGTVSRHREDLFNRYQGLPYGPGSSGEEREGYSKFTTREVMEAVEWALPSILSVFMSADRIVEFEPASAEDEGRAAQETDIVNYKILRANDGDGFIELANFVKDALINPTAYLKVYVEEAERTEIIELSDVLPPQLAELLADPEIELLEQRSRMERVPMPVPSGPGPGAAPDLSPGAAPGPPPMNGSGPGAAAPLHTTPGAPPGPLPGAPGGGPGAPFAPSGPLVLEVFDLKLRRTTMRPTLQIRGVPGEEMLVDARLTSTSIEEAEFVCHRQRKSLSDLLKMGFSKGDLQDVREDSTDLVWNEEKVNRMFYEDELRQYEEDEPYYEYDECYVDVDYSGDGKKERRYVVLIGGEIFINEETSYQPFIGMSSLMNPHKHIGLSVAELVLDIQLLLTTLTRQLLDNLYQLNVGKHAVDENAFLSDGSTVEALVNTQSRFVPVRGVPRESVAPMAMTTVLKDILPVIQDARQMTALRTGIAPENNVDPEVLQQSNTGAFMGAMTKANERLELIIRIMAETGFKMLCRKVHRLLRMHPSMAETVKLRGAWIPVDPSQWSSRTDMVVNVGLGFNSNQQLMSALMSLLGIQTEKLMGMGLAGPAEIYQTVEKLIRTVGLGSPNQYLKNPNMPGWQPPQPPPDPAMMAAVTQDAVLRADQMTKRQKVEYDKEISQRDQQIEYLKVQLEAVKSGYDLEHASEELELKRLANMIAAAAQETKETEADADARDTAAHTRLQLAQIQEVLSKVVLNRAKADQAENMASEPPKGTP